MKYKILAAILIVLQASFQMASAQCGDNCITATPLIVDTNGICIYDSCTTIGATPSGVNPATCSAVNNNDVWYTFTVPAGVTNLMAQVQGSATGMTYPIVYGFRGTCGSLAWIGCNSGAAPASLATLNMTTLIPGEQIWVRVKTVSGTPDGTFQICVFNPCPTGPPLYDEPCSALVVPMTAGCVGYTPVTNLCASSSLGIPAPGCVTFQGNDIWVQTTTNANGMLQVNFEEQTMLDVACAVYTGTCNALVLFACDDDNGPGDLPFLDLGLPPNSTVWIRIWSDGNASRGSVGICLVDDCPSGMPPANDNPCQATFIPVAASCSSFTTISNVCATSTRPLVNPPCGMYVNDDVWVKTNSGASGYLEITFQQQTLANVGAALYIGTCNSPGWVICDDDGGPGLMPRLLAGIAPGNDVWIRIWDHSGGDTGTVGVCITDPCATGTFMLPMLDNPPCPFPDSADSYIPVVSGPCSTYTTYRSECASPVFGNTPAGVPLPSGCSPTYPPGAAAGWDVWAPFIVPDTLATGTLFINTLTGTITDLDIAVYSVTSPVDSFCSNGSMYTLITCDEGSGSGNMPFIQLPFGGSNPVQAGDTLLLRMWDYFGGPTGTWGLCLSIPCPGNVAHDEPPCPGSATLLPVAEGPCTGYLAGNNYCATTNPAYGNPGCANWNNAPDVWYVVQMPDSGSGRIDLNVQPGQGIGDLGMAAYSGLPVACGGTGLTLLACDDDAGPGLMPYLSLINPVAPGDTIYVRVWAYGGQGQGTFSMCANDPCPPLGNLPISDNPPCPIPDTVSAFLPVTAGVCPGYVLCDSYCASTVFGTTPSGVPLPSGCAPTYPTGAATGWDVWAPFIVPDSPATGTLHINTVAGITLDLDMAVYSIASPVNSFCNNGSMYTLITCDASRGQGNMPHIQLPFGGGNPVQPGDTLLLRMWDYFGGIPGTWGVCINNPCLGPSTTYDDPPCVGSAVLLPVGDGPCTSFQQGNNFCATSDTSYGNPGTCIFVNNAPDVWYVVQMPDSGSGTVQLNVLADEDVDFNMAVYSGIPVSCGGAGLSIIACDDSAGPGLNPFLWLTNPVAPDDYFYVRIWGNGVLDRGSFSICANDPCSHVASPPLVDNPSCPLPVTSQWYLPVAQGVCPNFVQSDIFCASPVFGTTPSGLPVPSGCSGPSYPPGAASGWDVWSSVVVPDTPAAGFLHVRAFAGSILDLDFALYRITPPANLHCGDGSQYTLLACDDFSGPQSMPYIFQPYGPSSLVQPGDTLSLRMWRKNGGATGTWYMGTGVTTDAPDSICIVYVDSAMNKNAVVWEKANNMVERYRIYKESTPGGPYVLHGESLAAQQSVFIDVTSNPAAGPERYAISVVDTCGHEWMQSNPHRTMHLSVAPDTTGNWQLSWNAYEGFTIPWHYILRGPTRNSLVVLDSVPGLQTSYTDTSAPWGTMYYAVSINKSTNCFPSPNPAGTNFNASLSNIFEAIPVGLEQLQGGVQDFTIHPNPMTHTVQISFTLDGIQKARVIVYDIVGREIKQLMNSTKVSGNQKLTWDRRDDNNKPVAGGAYFIKLEYGNISTTKKIVVLP